MAIGALRLCQLLPPGLALLGRLRFESPRLKQRLLGLSFPNPLGLAAGFDKNGEAIPALAALGFGFLEVGTVTPRAQPGNPRPRVFRYPETESLENALGFNNRGAESLARRLSRLRRGGVPLGVNLGKNRDTPLAAAEKDYELLVETLDGLCDYWVINVSSPNTPGLRDLQSGERLADLLRRIGARTDLPVLVKLSPDLEPGEAVGLGRAAVEAGAAGLVLTNTTIDYSLLPGAPGGGAERQGPAPAQLRSPQGGGVGAVRRLLADQRGRDRLGRRGLP